MATKLKVEITSFALSSLLGNNANSDGDQEGFLFGEVFTKKGRDITDHDADGSTETTVIRITSHMFVFEPCEFYSRVGIIDENKIKETLGEFSTSVVGYFDFKRALPLEYGTIPGVRTNLMFKCLCDWTRSKANKTAIRAPLTLLVLRQNHMAKSTINNNYCFYIQDPVSRKLVKIASEIPNLGDTSQRQYVYTPGVPGVDDVVKSFLNNTPLKPDDMPVVKAHETMISELRKIAKTVADLEDNYHKTEAELKMLKREKVLTEEALGVLLADQAASPSGSSDRESPEPCNSACGTATPKTVKCEGVNNQSLQDRTTPTNSDTHESPAQARATSCNKVKTEDENQSENNLDILTKAASKSPNLSKRPNLRSDKKKI